MSHKIYKLKKGDTLQSVAEELQISVSALRDYHNKYCDLEYLIPREDKIPSHIKGIIISDKDITIDDKLKNIHCFSLYTNSKYEIGIKNVLLVNNETISENESKNIWNFSEINGCIDLNIIKKNILKSNVQLKPLLDIIMMINESTDHLKLALDVNNNIIEVLNKNEILEKWEEIKLNKIKFYEFKDEFIKIIVKQYDHAFKNITSHIQKNLLYQLIFFSCAKLKYPCLYPQLLKRQIVVNSLLFPEKNIIYDLKYTSKETKEYLLFNLTTEVPSTSLNHFKEIYEKGYSKLIKTAFSPTFIIESSYFFNKKNNKLEKAIIYVKEQMNKDLMYIAQYTLTNISLKM